MAKGPLPNFKRGSIRSKIFNYVFIGYAQNSAAYKFISSEDSSINESRDAKFFEHVFPLKRNVSTIVHETIPMYDNMPMFVSSTSVKDSVDEPRRSKRPRVGTNFGPDFLTNSLIEDFNVNFVSDELVYAFFIEEDVKTYEDAMRSTDVSLWKKAIKSEIRFHRV